MLKLKTTLVALQLHHNNNVKMESQVCVSLLRSQIWFWSFSWPYWLENSRMVGFYTVLIFKVFCSLVSFFCWWGGQISPSLCKSGRLWVSDFCRHQGDPGLKCFGADTMQVLQHAIHNAEWAIYVSYPVSQNMFETADRSIYSLGRQTTSRL